jgi:hypothetical protein
LVIPHIKLDDGNRAFFSSAMVHRISRENFAAHFGKLGG